MSAVLIDADPELQIKRAYVMGWDKEKCKADGYCAVGLLSCKSGAVNKETGQPNNESLSIYYDLTAVQPVQLYTCPEDCGEPDNLGLYGVIIHLNDVHSWTYKEIGQFLKDKGL